MAKRRRQSERIPLAEWIVAAIGVIVVAGSLVLVLEQGSERGDTPPQLVVRADSVYAHGTQYLVTLHAFNAGGRTASSVGVEGLLISGRDTLERSTAEIDFVPPGSRRQAGLIFRADPRNATLVLRALGYQTP